MRRRRAAARVVGLEGVLAVVVFVLVSLGIAVVGAGGLLGYFSFTNCMSGESPVPTRGCETLVLTPILYGVVSIALGLVVLVVGVLLRRAPKLVKPEKATRGDQG